MNITLYQNKSDPKVVNKDISSLPGLFYTGNIRGSFDVMRGVVTIATDDNLANYNYAYLSDISRYYYVTDRKIIRTGLWELTLECDVLMSYASGIRELSGTVARSTSLNNGYISDPEYQALTYSQIVAKTFPNAMTDDQIILMTIG